MEKEKRDLLIQNLKSAMDTQARISLKIDVEWALSEQVYTKKDLENASLIFVHVVGNMWAWHLLNNVWIPIEEYWHEVQKFWWKLRSMIKELTWYDTNNLFY